MRNSTPESTRQPRKIPLLRLIRSVEQLRDTCYACDQAPLDDMIVDLRRWAAELTPQIEVPTVRERLKARK